MATQTQTTTMLMMRRISLMNSLWYLSHIIIYIGNLSRFTLVFVTQSMVCFVFVTFSAVYVWTLSRFQWEFVTISFGVCHKIIIQQTVSQPVATLYMLYICLLFKIR